jgi:hypothetical protein
MLSFFKQMSVRTECCRAAKVKALLPLLRRPHDHHREVRTRRNAAISTKPANASDQDRHVMMPSLAINDRYQPQELGPAAWNDTVVVVISEFGRTFRENGNRGTDHGHGSVRQRRPHGGRAAQG